MNLFELALSYHVYQQNQLLHIILNGTSIGLQHVMVFLVLICLQHCLLLTHTFLNLLLVYLFHDLSLDLYDMVFLLKQFLLNCFFQYILMFLSLYYEYLLYIFYILAELFQLLFLILFL